jgi:hypothetical protein
MATIISAHLTWSELLDRAALPETQAWRETKGRMSARPDVGGWYGTADYAASLILLREGWTEGRERFVSGLSSLAPPTIKTMQRRLDVAGAYPIAAMAAAGAMDCMVDLGETIIQRPNLKMVVGVSAGGGIDAKCITNRGIAIASLIDAIETSGTRLELIAERRATSGRWDLRHSITVKELDQPLELDRLAYVLAHPSMLRRTLGRIEEQVTTPLWNEQGYGMPTAALSSDWPDAVMLPSMSLAESARYSTPQSALASVLRVARAAGIEIATD